MPFVCAEDPDGDVTTFEIGAIFNVTWHLAYPHRVSV